jgi:hypothetical protein
MTDINAIYADALAKLKARLGRKDKVTWTEAQRNDAGWHLWELFNGPKQGRTPTSDPGLRAIALWQFARACHVAGVTSGLPGHDDPDYMARLESVQRSIADNQARLAAKANRPPAPQPTKAPAKQAAPAKKTAKKAAPEKGAKPAAKSAPAKKAPAAPTKAALSDPAQVPVTVAAGPAETPAPVLATAPAAPAAKKSRWAKLIGG